MRLVSRSRNPTAAQQRDLALLLALAVAARVRASDFVGWRTDPEELGLILPDTSAEGAAALIQSIERRLAPRLAAAPELGPLAPELVCEVFHSSHPLGADPHAQFL